MEQFKTARHLFSQKQYAEALAELNSATKKHPEFAHIYKANMVICKKQIEKEASKCSIEISLTTINQRLNATEKVIESLSSQTTLPEKINLYISKEAYLLDQGIKEDDPILKQIEKNPLVAIHWVKNTGPYRKIIPYVTAFFDKQYTNHKKFITVDDDTIYPPYFIERLVAEHKKHDCVIAFRGRKITKNEKSIEKYAKLGLGSQEPLIENLPTGKDGIIYCTSFFTREFINIEKAIELAPTADDMWIKWHTSMNGVKSVILNPEASTSDYKSFPVFDYSKEFRDLSLFKMHNADGAGSKNDKTVNSLEEHFKSQTGLNLFEMMDF